MTARVVVYAGSTESTGLSDLSTGHQLARAADRADGVVVLDPMSFPWEALDPGCATPFAVDVSRLSNDDVVALAPILRTLTSADLVLGTAGGVDDLFSDEALVCGRAEDDSTFLDHVASASAEKRMAVDERLLLDSLDDDLIVVRISGSELRGATAGFPELLTELRARDASLVGATVEVIWGVRSHPGAAVDRAIVAFRLRDRADRQP